MNVDELLRRVPTIHSDVRLHVKVLQNQSGKPFEIIRDDDKYSLYTVPARELAGELIVTVLPSGYLYLDGVEIGSAFRGERLCTPFVTAALREFLARQSIVPVRATVSILSYDAQAAYACYVNAFDNVGYKTYFTADPTVAADGRTARTATFVRKDLTEDERQGQKRRLHEFLGL